MYLLDFENVSFKSTKKKQKKEFQSIRYKASNWFTPKSIKAKGIASNNFVAPGNLRDRKVVIKAYISKNIDNCKWQEKRLKHAHYLTRDEVNKNGKQAKFFSFDGLERAELNEYISRTQCDAHEFRFIISPENGDLLDLPSYTQDLLTIIQLDVGTKLEWYGVAHYNTDNPHVHLLVRGAKEDGTELRFSRDYIKEGFRNRAQQLATAELGQRSKLEIQLSLKKELKAERITNLDRLIYYKQGTGHRFNLDSIQPVSQDSIKSRLEKLKELKLARPLSSSQWELKPNFLKELQIHSQSKDIIKLLHKESSQELKKCILFNPATSSVIEGRIIKKGPIDEIKDTEYILVCARDKSLHYVELSNLKLAQKCEIGSIVQVRSASPERLPKSAENIIKAASQNADIFSPLILKRNAQSKFPNLTPDAIDSFVQFHRKKAIKWAAQGLIVQEAKDKWKVPKNFLELLRHSQKSEKKIYLEVLEKSKTLSRTIK